MSHGGREWLKYISLDGSMSLDNPYSIQLLWMLDQWDARFHYAI